jgi:hypothetical protein
MHSELTISKSAFAANVRVACSLLRPGTNSVLRSRAIAYGTACGSWPRSRWPTATVYIGVCTNAEVETAAESLAARDYPHRSCACVRHAGGGRGAASSGAPVEELVGSWQEAL